MLSGGEINWQEDFPLRDEVEDFAGTVRSFVISCYEGGLGYTVRAEEEGKSGMGYQFGAYSETSPYSALGRVRDKMRRALASRHITNRPDGYALLHDVLRGRIIWGQAEGVRLIVDGMPLEVEDLTRILSSHEGWEFELKIRDSLE